MSARRSSFPFTVIATLLIGLALGWLAGYARLDEHLVSLWQRATGTRQYLAPPDSVSAEYRRQRLALFRASKAQADVVMLGDSHTEGGPWSELLPGVTVINRGIGWDSSEDVLKRLDEVIARRPRMVFLLIGVVDLRRGAEPDAVAERIESIAAQLKAAGIRPVVQSVLPVAASLREPTNEKVRRLNERLRRSTDFLDLHPDLVKQGALDPALTYDGVHLVGPAYLLWAARVAPLLQR